MEKQDSKKRSVLDSFLSGNLRFLRRRRKLSQEKLALEVSLNRGNIASYENGSAAPKICNLVKIADFFRISVSDLTQHDLSCELAPKVLPSRLQGLAPEEREKIDKLYKNSAAFNDFLKGIHSCYQYKMNSLNEDGAPSKDIIALKNYFEQLYEASEQMAKQHHVLLKMCQCDSTQNDT